MPLGQWLTIHLKKVFMGKEKQLSIALKALVSMTLL